jgi:hypothetical protein
VFFIPISAVAIWHEFRIVAGVEERLSLLINSLRRVVETRVPPVFATRPSASMIVLRLPDLRTTCFLVLLGILAASLAQTCPTLYVSGESPGHSLEERKGDLASIERTNRLPEKKRANGDGS